jgi:hypothetical protein
VVNIQISILFRYSGSGCCGLSWHAHGDCAQGWLVGAMVEGGSCIKYYWRYKYMDRIAFMVFRCVRRFSAASPTGARCGVTVLSGLFDDFDGGYWYDYLQADEVPGTLLAVSAVLDRTNVWQRLSDSW